MIKGIGAFCHFYEVMMADLEQMDAQMDVSALVREELVTDRKIGSIRVLTPILKDGSRDMEREVIYLGETQIMTQMGPLPISFEIKATNLAEAIDSYGAAAKQGVQETIAKLEEMRRQAASKIVTPGDAGFAATANKIQMP